MLYVKVQFDPNTIAYQEADVNGNVQRYLDEAGVLLFEQPPVDVGCVILDADPPRLGWML